MLTTSTGTEKARPKVFFGWWIVLATSIVSGLGTSFYRFGISVLFKPIASELFLSRAATSVATGIGRLEAGLAAPLTGWLLDKFGPRWAIFTGVCILGVGLVLMNFINSAWTYYLVWGLTIGSGINLGLTMATDKTTTDWFVRKRGLATGIKFMIIGIMGVIVLPVVSWLVTKWDWRTTCMIWAAVMFAGAPFIWVFVKQRRPEYYGLLPDGARPELKADSGSSTMINKGLDYAAGFQETDFAFKQALKTSTYWLLLIPYAIHMMVMAGFSIHVVPFLTDMGIAPSIAGSMMGIMVFFTIPSRFLAGLLTDRVGKRHLKFLLMGAYLSQIIGIGLFLFYQSLPAIYALLILYGFGSGAQTPLVILMRARYFGRKAYGSIHGISLLIIAPLSLFAPIYAGWIYDSTGSYIIAFTTFAVALILATFSAFLLTPPRLPSS